MSLKAIKRTSFDNIIEVLDAIEKIEQQSTYGDTEGWQSQDLRERLRDKHERYEDLITAIAAQIEDFDRLYRRLLSKLLI